MQVVTITRDEILEAIGWLEKMKRDAVVVLNSGFGRGPGESSELYVRRKRLAEIALVSLYKDLEELDKE